MSGANVKDVTTAPIHKTHSNTGSVIALVFEPIQDQRYLNVLKLGYFDKF